MGLRDRQVAGLGGGRGGVSSKGIWSALQAHQVLFPFVNFFILQLCGRAAPRELRESPEESRAKGGGPGPAEGCLDFPSLDSEDAS